MVNMEDTSSAESRKSQIPPKSVKQQPVFTGDETNPFGLGDPNDRFLRKVEKEILVPKKMRDRARIEKCTEEVAAFNECCKKSSIAMVVTCRKQNTAMKACLTHWYQDPTFRKECEDEYLNERSEYRRTGLKQKFWAKKKEDEKK